MKRTPAPSKKRNHIAADLRTPKYRKRVVANKLIYNRKEEDNGIHTLREDSSSEDA